MGDVAELLDDDPALGLDDSAKPAWEWIGGQAVQKMSPTNWHAFLQREFAERLNAWAGANGRVGTEWRFRVPPNEYDTRSLVPDVAYISTIRYLALDRKDRTYPSVPPELVIEILSPEERASRVASKKRAYLSWGVVAVLIADPETRSIEMYDRGASFKFYGSGKTFTHENFPGLALPIDDVFAVLDEPE
jgi:Uma2 family endonuclease